MNIDELKVLGFSNGEIKVYKAVLEIGRTSLNRIQQKTGIERRNIYDILNKLIEKGIVSFTTENKTKVYRATHPSQLKETIEEQEGSLQSLKKKLPALTELYASAKIPIGAEVYRGNDAIKNLLDEVLTQKESFWLGGNSFQDYSAVPKNLQDWFQHWMTRRMEQHHKMHDLVDYGTHLKGLPPKSKLRHKKSFYEYRQLPKDLRSPLVIIIFGNKVAQVLWSEQSFAFVIESEEIKESYMKYFNYFWGSKPTRLAKARRAPVGRHK